MRQSAWKTAGLVRCEHSGIRPSRLRKASRVASRQLRCPREDEFADLNQPQIWQSNARFETNFDEIISTQIEPPKLFAHLRNRRMNNEVNRSF